MTSSNICRNTIFKELQNFVHLNLAIALSLALVVFVSGIETATANDVSIQFTEICRMIYMVCT